MDLKITDDALDQIAKLCITINNKYRNMGARTLHLVLEKVFSDISFNAFCENDPSEFTIDSDYIRNIRKEILKEFNNESFKEMLDNMVKGMNI